MSGPNISCMRKMLAKGTTKDGIETTGEKNRQSGMVTESATTHQAAWNPVEMVNTLMVRRLRSNGACIGVPVSLSRPALPKSRSRKEYSQHLSIFVHFIIGRYVIIVIVIIERNQNT